MQEKYTLNIGLFDRDIRRQRISTVEAYKIVENIITDKLSGGSIFEGRGVYRHDNGSIVIEPSLMVELYDTTEAIRALK